MSKRRSPSPALSLVVAAALAPWSCRATLATASNASASRANLSSPESSAVTPSEVLVRAREAPPMPRCEATDALAIAPLSIGTPARPSLARSASGGLVAFVTDPSGNGATRLNLMALDAQGAPGHADGRGSETVVLSDTGPNPDAPCLAALGETYVLAWRQGAPGQQRVMVRTLDARGVPSGDARGVGPGGWLGAPTLTVVEGRWHVAVARSAARSSGGAWASHIDVSDADGTRSVAAPDGGAFDGDAPTLVRTPAGVRVYATVAQRGAGVGDERALVRLLDAPEDRVTLVARDLDHPAALAVDGGVLLAWRARMTRHEASMRAAMLPFEGEPAAPPITIATYRGAFDARVALVSIGARERPQVGALTLSTLADDAAGSLNLSVLDRDGAYVGRAPIITGFPVRATAFATASAPAGAPDDSAWVAVDGREADGAGASLLVTRVQCDARRPVERLDVPPSTFEQDLSPPDDAPIRMPREVREMSCQVRATGAFTPHVSGRDDVLAGTEGAVTITAAGAVMLAVTTTAAAARPRLMLSTLDAQGRAAPARAVLDGATHLLALEPMGAAALAVVTVAAAQAPERVEVVTVRGAVVTRAAVAGLREATSAAVVPEAGVAFVVARDAAGDTVLARVSLVAGRAAVTTLTTLRAGDRVLDAAREGAETHVLVARPDPMGGELGQSLARVVLGNATRAVRDPFADPIGHARDAALFTRVGTSLALAYNERSTLRVGAIARGQVRDARSLVETFAGGGAVLSSAWGAGVRWVALATGAVDDGRAHLRAVTLVALDERGDVRGLTARLPEDPDAVAPGMALGARGDRVVIVHPRTERQGASWRWVDATCAVQGGAR